MLFAVTRTTQVVIKTERKRVSVRRGVERNVGGGGSRIFSVTDTVSGTKSMGQGANYRSCII